MQLVAPWFQQRRILMAQHKYRRNHAIHRASRFAEEKYGRLFKSNGEPDDEVLKQ